MMCSSTMNQTSVNRERRGCLLLVDGDLARAQRLAQRLPHPEFEVHLADNGASALLLAHDLLPDVIIAASDLPIMDGHLMLAALRSKPETRDATVILLTEGMSHDELSRCWKAGADLCVPRSQGDVDVVATLHRALSSVLIRDDASRNLAYVS